MWGLVDGGDWVLRKVKIWEGGLTKERKKKDEEG